MGYWLLRLGLLLFGYCFGIIETGMIYSKIKGVDLKHSGSGNTGATNTLRVAGPKAGVIVLLGDVFKCIIPMVIVSIVFRNELDVKTLMYYTGIGCILGHNFPFYSHFKGGKGVACSGAIVIVLDPIDAVIALSLFAFIVYLTGYVSLGSLIAATVAVIGFVVHMIFFKWYATMSVMGMIEFICLGLLMILLMVIQHRKNIERLVNGTENKIYDRHKKKAEKPDENKEKADE